MLLGQDWGKKKKKKEERKVENPRWTTDSTFPSADENSGSTISLSWEWNLEIDAEKCSTNEIWNVMRQEFRAYLEKSHCRRRRRGSCALNKSSETHASSTPSINGHWSTCKTNTTKYTQYKKLEHNRMHSCKGLHKSRGINSVLMGAE